MDELLTMDEIKQDAGMNVFWELWAVDGRTAQLHNGQTVFPARYVGPASTNRKHWQLCYYTPGLGVQAAGHFGTADEALAHVVRQNQQAAEGWWMQLVWDASQGIEYKQHRGIQRHGDWTREEARRAVYAAYGVPFPG